MNVENDEWRMTNGGVKPPRACRMTSGRGEMPHDTGVGVRAARATRHKGRKNPSRANDCGARPVRLCQALSDPRIFKSTGGHQAAPRSSIFGDIRSNSAIFAQSGQKIKNYENKHQHMVTGATVQTANIQHSTFNFQHSRNADYPGKSDLIRPKNYEGGNRKSRTRRNAGKWAVDGGRFALRLSSVWLRAAFPSPSLTEKRRTLFPC